MANQQHVFALYVSVDLASVDTMVSIEDPILYHRIIRVLRLACTQVVILFNNQIHAHAELVAVDKKKCTFVLRSVQHNIPLEPRITAVVPLLKGVDLEDAISWVTQVGATDIQLLKTDYSQRSWHGSGDLDKLVRSIVAVTEQSKQFCMPPIYEPMSLVQLLQVYKEALIFVGSPSGSAIATNISILKTGKFMHIMFLAGPEADFSPREYELLAQASVHFVSLGPTVLRSSTACQLGVGMLRALLI